MLRFPLLCFLLTTIQLCSCGIRKREIEPIPGEPLTPEDFERGENLVLNLTASENVDDGTMDDILEPTGRAFSDRGVHRWPDAALPYVLDEAFTKDDRASIARAIHLIQQNTCFKIIPRTDQRDYVYLLKNFRSTACNSYVGLVGGKQVINIAPWCIQKFGDIAHELMHAMGFYHEHYRKERKSYITINVNNIKEGHQRYFKEVSGDYGNVYGPYDLLSIMHYAKTAFSRNGKETISLLKDNGEKLGQREKLTSLDAAKVNFFYNCKGIGPEETHLAQDKACRDTLHETDCARQAAFNLCKLKPKFMAVYCKKTCKLCKGGCDDFNVSCGEWRRKNYCGKYTVYMKLYCPKSCRVC